MRLICKLNGWDTFDMRDKWFRISPDQKGKVDGTKVTKLFINGNGVICCIMNDVGEKYRLEINCQEDGTAETDSIVLVRVPLLGRNAVPLNVRLLFRCGYDEQSARVCIAEGSTVQIEVNSVMTQEFTGHEDDYRREYRIEQDLPENQSTDALVDFLSDYIREVFEQETDYRTKALMKRRLGLTEQIYRGYQDYKRELERQTPYEIVMPVWNVILGGGKGLPRYSFLRTFFALYLEMGCGAEAFTPEVPVFLNMTDGKYQVDDLSQVEININRTLYNYQGEAYGSDNAVRNATSTVVNFIYNGAQSILFPGDATFHVLGDIAARVSDSGAKPGYMIAPHHGSYHTNFAGNMGAEDAAQPLVDLYSKIEGVTTYISANHRKHAMPRREFVKIAIEKGRRGVASHRLGYCDTDSKDSYNSDPGDRSRVYGNTDAAVYNTEQLSEGQCGYYYKDLMSEEETQLRASGQAAGTPAGPALAAGVTEEDIPAGTAAGRAEADIPAGPALAVGRAEADIPAAGIPAGPAFAADAPADGTQGGRYMEPARRKPPIRRLPPDRLFL